MNDNNISFKSNIEFVPVKKIKKINKIGEKIGFWQDENNLIKAPEFYTTDIRTCTAGGLVVPHKEALGFHYLDTSGTNYHFKHIKNFLNRLKTEITPERGLLVGSKEIAKNKGYIYTVKTFRKIQKTLQKLTPNLTIFENHNYKFSQTHFHYSLENDTWTLCHHFIDEEGNEDYVKNLEDLKKCFKRIKIAKGDKLFINGEQINSADAAQAPNRITEYMKNLLGL